MSEENLPVHRSGETLPASGSRGVQADATTADWQMGPQQERVLMPPITGLAIHLLHEQQRQAPEMRQITGRGMSGDVHTGKELAFPGGHSIESVQARMMDAVNRQKERITANLKGVPEGKIDRALSDAVRRGLEVARGCMENPNSRANALYIERALTAAKDVGLIGVDASVSR